MPRFGNGRPDATNALLITGATFALVIVQHFAGLAAVAETVTTAETDAHNFLPLEQAAIAAPLMVDAAVPLGDFEELVKPTPAPAAEPSPELTADLTPEPTIAPADTSDVTPVPQPEPIAPKLRLFESGVASTYGEGDGFEGNRTACGQIFHTAIVQLAHKTLPCGTTVRVEDTATGRSVDATVTDRGPYIAGRVVDLSWAAFRQINPAGPGLRRVNVYILD